MNTKKKLFESKPTDPEVLDFLKASTTIYHPFIEKWMRNCPVLKEAGEAGEGEPESGGVVGTAENDAQSIGVPYATLEIFNAVIRGFTRYMDDSFVRKYVTDSYTFKIPLTEYRELADVMTAAEFPHTEKTLAYANVTMDEDSEKGAKCTWTRALLEDITFDVQAELMEGLGHAIAKLIMESILDTVMALATDPENSGMPLAELATVSSPITWAEFLTIVGAVDRGLPVDDNGTVTDIDNATSFKTYGPADYVLVSSDIYWELLNIIQMTNVLYEGSTDPINQGKIKLALGCTVSKQSLLPPRTVIALNSAKAIALVTRRALRIEPVVFPAWNEYGFLGSVRFGTTVLYSGAIQIGQTA